MWWDAPTYQFFRKKGKRKGWNFFFGLLDFSKVSERSGGVKCDLILHLHSSEGFSSSPHTLLKHYLFKHITGQGESDTYMTQFEEKNRTHTCFVEACCDYTLAEIHDSALKRYAHPSRGTFCRCTFKNGCEIHYRCAGRVPAGVPDSIQQRRGAVGILNS